MILVVTDGGTGGQNPRVMGRSSVRSEVGCAKAEQDLSDALGSLKGVRWPVELAATVGQYQYTSAIHTPRSVSLRPRTPPSSPSERGYSLTSASARTPAL